MAYYFSERACTYIGMQIPKEISNSSERNIGFTKGMFKLGLKNQTTKIGSITPEEYVSQELKKKKFRQFVRKSIYDVTSPEQIIETTLFLKVGKMKFLRVPGAQQRDDFYAFWGHGKQVNRSTGVDCNIILVGSLDNLTGSDYSKEASKVDEYNFPSDPALMTKFLSEQLDINVDKEDYLAQTAEDSWQPEYGRAAEAALGHTTRAYESRAIGDNKNARTSWVDYQANARIIAVASDIFDSSSNNGGHASPTKTVLARPISVIFTPNK